MILTSKTVIHYLLDRSLLPATAVVDGDVVVVEVARRNNNYQVRRRQGPGLFVKQTRAWDPPATLALKREAFCYWLAQGEGEFSALAEIAPAYRFYDPERNVLVTELVPGNSLHEFHQREGRFPSAVGAALGRHLAVCHTALTAEAVRRKFPGTFPEQPPWILSFHQQPQQQLPLISAANSQLLAVLRRYPDFPLRLDALRARWQPQCLTHADIKWDNCVVEKVGADGEVRMRLVDWELSDLGHPAWDIGATLQTYLSWWICSMDLAPGLAPAQWLRTAKVPLASLQPAIHAFWAAYRKAVPLSDALASSLLEHSAACAAARMIQAVYEQLQFSHDLTPLAICLLQVSINVLSDPSKALRELFNL
jgi:hypothetical protein